MFKATPDQPNIQNKFIKFDSQMLNQLYGTDQVTPYWIADIDFPVASPITEAMQQLVNRETYSYEFDSKTVFQSISDWNRERHNLTLNPEHFVQVPGVLSAIALLIRDFTKEGDGVLIQTPVYHQFRRLIESAGRNVVGNTMRIEDGHYAMDFERLEQQLKSGDVQMILLCNPHNPVGRVWTKAELERMVALAKKYNTLIVSDEIHADIVFQGSTFTSMTSLGYDNSLTIIGSPAKSFGLCSLAAGYIYSDNDALLGKIKATAASLSVDHENIFTTYATIAAYQQGQAWFESFHAYTENTRNWILNFIEQNLPQINAFPPQGTNQIWLDFTGLALEASELKTLLTEQAKMALTPGTWFGEPNENFYRMNFASPLEQIQTSFQLLKSAVDHLECRLEQPA